jgi:hypothetical protein
MSTAPSAWANLVNFFICSKCFIIFANIFFQKTSKICTTLISTFCSVSGVLKGLARKHDAVNGILRKKIHKNGHLRNGHPIGHPGNQSGLHLHKELFTPKACLTFKSGFVFSVKLLCKVGVVPAQQKMC